VGGDARYVWEFRIGIGIGFHGNTDLYDIEVKEEVIKNRYGVVQVLVIGDRLLSP